MVAKHNRYILRNEVFGKTLYDKKNLFYSFLKNDSKELKQLDFSKVDFWGGDTKGIRKDIIFSPIRVYFELTNDCNLRCRTCFNESGQKGNNEMDLETVAKTLDGFRKDNIFDMRFTGGEMTMRPDWFEILTHAKQLGFAISNNTNGIYNNQKDVINKLTSLDLEQITISIDGNQKLNDYIRGAGTYDKAVETIKQLSDKGNVLRINSIITKNSKDSIKDILDMAVKYVDEINFFYFRPIGRGANLVDQAVNFQEYREFNNLLIEMKDEYMDKGLNILHTGCAYTSNGISDVIAKDLGINPGQTDGFTRWNICQDGTMSAGGYTPYIRPDLNMGNIVTEGFTTLDIWRNSADLDIFRNKSTEVYQACIPCEEKGINCQGESMELALYREKYGTNEYCKYRGLHKTITPIEKLKNLKN